MTKPILCYVTDRKLLAASAARGSTEPLLQQIGKAARAGVDWIQLREKDLEGRALFDLASRALAASAASASDGKTRTRILINDRLDVALAAQSAGVHLGENSLPAGEVTRWRDQAGRSADFLVGASCHSREAAEQFAGARCDYIFFGPVFATPAKEQFGPPQGLQKLEAICRAVSIPVLAIGGITAENAKSCLEAGAAGIAAIRLFQEAADLPVLLDRIRF